MLIDAERLSRNLSDPNWIVFDCRHDLMKPEEGRKAYLQGHLPGAFFAPVDTALAGPKTGSNGRHPLPDPAHFAEFLARHGVTPRTQIVAYDESGGQYAARLWWLARWIGLNNVLILDGGFRAWTSRGQRVTLGLATPTRTGDVTPRPDRSAYLSCAEVLDAITAQRALVVDARAPERYRGETEPIDPVAGHIPTARNRFYSLNLKPDQTLRPANELRNEFEAVITGWTPATVVHQCGSGITGCANLFAMEYAGLIGSKLFAGSWSEWCCDPSRPVARGAS